MKPMSDPTDVLLFLTEGFEDLEAVSILDACGWTVYRPGITRARVVKTGLHREVHGRFGTSFQIVIASSAGDELCC